jgi:hypothetical protein
MQHSYVVFIILQENINIIKVEDDVDVLSEEVPIGLKTNEVYIPSPFALKKAEPKVSHNFR